MASSATTANRPLPTWPFSGPSVLAPMEGVTHPLFRALAIERGGLHLVCTEFVRITSQPVSKRQLLAAVQKSGNCPLSVQVMGNAAERMADAASIVAASGADVVDINLGCPMPRVVRKGVGAAMLKDPVLLGQVLRRMRRATSGLLSAKIRAGFDDQSSVVEIAHIVEDSGVDFLTVHPRRRADFYSGVADWRIIRLLKETLQIPVVGNGDVWYAADALRMQRETGCDAVMIGRPALRNPWIFPQIEQLRRGAVPTQPNGATLFAHLRATAERYAEYFGAARKYGALGPMKELLSWVGRSVNDNRAFLRRVLRQHTLDAVLSECEQSLADLPEADLDLDAHGSLALERSGSANSNDASSLPTLSP